MYIFEINLARCNLREEELEFIRKILESVSLYFNICQFLSSINFYILIFFILLYFIISYMK